MAPLVDAHLTRFALNKAIHLRTVGRRATMPGPAEPSLRNELGEKESRRTAIDYAYADGTLLLEGTRMRRPTPRYIQHAKEIARSPTDALQGGLPSWERNSVYDSLTEPSLLSVIDTK
jgi:hypothetical protein